MYHYIAYSAEGGGRLLRDPAEIREEMAAIRDLLARTEERMQAAEEKKEELILLLGEGDGAPACLPELREVVDESESLKRRMEGLWERTDLLGTELSDALYLLRGIRI